MLAGLALLALALAWLAAGTARATFPGENGRIAFARSGAIYVINPDGSGRGAFLICERLESPRFVDPSKTGISEPAWSSDGRRVAFAGTVWISTFANHFLYTVNSDGTGLAQVLDSSGDGGVDLAWSPDGEKIAYWVEPPAPLVGSEEDETPPDRIGVLNLDSGRSSLLAEGRQPAWSPDGRTIAFWHSGIWVIDADGTNERRLTGGGSSPNWSPDGKRIAFVREEFADFRHVQEIWTMNADGSDQKLLTDEGSSPAWSPDGEKIAFTRGPFRPKLYVMNADGSDQTRLGEEDDRVQERDPDWQPLPPGASPAPSQFCFGQVRRNTKRGIARLAVEIPRPGRVVLHRRPGVKRFASAHRDEGTGRVVLKIRPRGKARQRLNSRTSRLPVRAQVTYRPRVGEPQTKGRRVWLVKR